MTRVTLDYNRSAAVHQERGHVTFRQQSHLATVVISVMGLDDDKVTNSRTVGQYLSSLQVTTNKISLIVKFIQTWKPRSYLDVKLLSRNNLGYANNNRLSNWQE